MATAAVSFSPRYQRFSLEITGLLLRISSALGTIRGARVLPAVADQLRASARAETVHYSTMIEGNELPFVAAERAARGELDATTRAKIELVNYVAALDLIDERVVAGTLELTPELLKELHGAAMQGLGREQDAHFKPWHEGEWRDGVAQVVDRLTGKVMHEGPPSNEVSGRMTAMFEWLHQKMTTNHEPPFVLAGVMHYGVTDVHPFADGNGRAARLLQAALLMRSDVLPGRMLSFERYYAEDREAYYAALRSVRLRTFNMEQWLEYLLSGLAEEYERVAETVADLGALVSGTGDGPLQLTASQERALAALRVEGRSEFTRRDYERAARVSRSTAGEDLKQLVRHGIVLTRGRGSATRYAFSVTVKPSPVAGSRRGRPAKWDDARIQRELRQFLADCPEWPTPQQFRNAGRGDLYSAASRSGGIGRWRRLFAL